MRRAGPLAVLTAALLAVTTLLVPATAHADVTKANLSVAFDNLSTDRVATVTLEAASASGVTGVDLIVEQPSDGDAWTQLATLPFTRTGGTANDGTWQAQYQLDIATNPGDTRFNAEITTADGATETASWQYIDNCYPLTITDLASSPDVIDADTPVTITGRVLARKTQGGALEPAPNVSVWNTTSPVLTAADGSFSFTHPYASALSLQANAGWLGQDQWCATADFAPSPEITRQSVELTAEIVTPQPVEVGDQVTVEGSLQRNGATGPVPAGKVWIAAYVTNAQKEHVSSALTAADGTFQMTFAAQKSGPVTVQSGQTAILWAGEALPGQVRIAGGPQISEFAVTPSPVGYQQPVHATGKLTDGTTGSPIANAEVSLQFSATGENWQEVKRGTTTTAGLFDIESTATTQDGYWRVWYASPDGGPTATSDIRQVAVQYGTVLEDFKAEAGSDPTVTVQGRLLRQDGTALGELPINVYFMADGESTWEFQGSTTTSADGSFSAQFTSYTDGYWTAAFWGNDDYTRSNAPIGHVDVPGQWTTEFTEFTASPATVPSGGTITVAGLLNRSVGGGTPEPAPDKPIYIYFLPAGGQGWQQVAVTQTGADGRFEESFTAEQDGYWTAWFYGDEGHLSVNAGNKHVDVQ